jgi:hypothetical protein
MKKISPFNKNLSLNHNWATSAQTKRMATISPPESTTADSGAEKAPIANGQTVAVALTSIENDVAANTGITGVGTVTPDMGDAGKDNTDEDTEMIEREKSEAAAAESAFVEHALSQTAAAAAGAHDHITSHETEDQDDDIEPSGFM